MKVSKFVRPSFLASIVLVASSGALAGTATANLNMSTTVVNSCLISTSPLAFGSYDITSTTDVTTTGSVSVTCTLGAAVMITLGEGAHADTGSGADAPLRRMNDSGSNFLNYALFQNLAMSSTWGNSEDSGKGSTGTGAEESHTVYGKLPAGQNVPAGAYADSVVATVTF